MTAAPRPLALLAGHYAICRFPPDAPLPVWVFHDAARVWSLTRTPEELSLVCDEDDLPPSVTPAPGRWRALRVEGPIPFEEVGVIARIAGALASAEVPVFVLSTHDTDLVLVPEETLDRARAALEAAGHAVRG